MILVKQVGSKQAKNGRAKSQSCVPHVAPKLSFRILNCSFSLSISASVSLCVAVVLFPELCVFLASSQPQVKTRNFLLLEHLHKITHLPSIRSPPITSNHIQSHPSLPTTLSLSTIHALAIGIICSVRSPLCPIVSPIMPSRIGVISKPRGADAYPTPQPDSCGSGSARATARSWRRCPATSS